MAKKRMKKENKIIAVFLAGSILLGGAGIGTATNWGQSTSSQNATVLTTSSSSSSKTTTALTTAQYSTVATAVSSMPTTAKEGADTSTSEDTKVDLTEGSYTITKAGTYYFTGSNDDAQIIVKAADDAEVTIYLNGVQLTSKSGPAIDIQSADKVKISTVTDSVSIVSDTSNTDSKAAIYSKVDVNFKGEGTLVALGNSNNAIQSSDDLEFKSGTVYAKTTMNDAIKGKDSIQIEGGMVVAIAADKGLNSDQDNGNAEKSYIKQTDGELYIQAGGEGASAATIDLQGGKSYLESGDDAWNASSKVLTPKFLMSGGTTTYHAGGDGIDSNGTLSVTGGTINANMNSTGDNEPIDTDSLTKFENVTFTAGGTNNAFPESDSQSYVLVGAVNAGDTVTVKDSSGNVVGTFTATEAQSNFIVSNSSITSGQTYSVTVGSGTSTDVTAGTGATIGMGNMGGGMGPGGR
ncbi:MAG: carbohydrate-binding domain-containing protein [Lactobacillaceae bacterium]|jgi:hypothetical protein|nr:carbohydrate-binding domain-containing protein [Lactobacillaceae bacterium]